MTDVNQAQEHLAFLVENITSPYEQLLLLRSSLEASLLKLGHDNATVQAVLDDFYARDNRTIH